MTIVHQADSEATLPLPPAGPVRLRFIGRIGDYWRLMIRGAALQAVTLGIYRFWLFTDMRRFLWSGTRIGDETPEYTGTATELLIGFLLAIGILLPVYALFFVGSLELGLLSRLSGVIAFVVLAGFGQYAAYRARRYRLTRTVFRGLRLHQTGSALLYAVRAMLWWIPNVLTLGLAWPWATANLERYKMRHTFYGNLGGSFAGSGTRLFGSGLLIWLLVVGTLAGGVAAGIAAMDWDAVGRVVKSDKIKDFNDLVGLLAIEAAGNDRVKYGFALMLVSPLVSLLFAAVLYPAYQAIMTRWWIGGLRLGGAAAASDLRIGRYYRVYLVYLAWVMLFTLVFIAAVVLAAGSGYLVRGHVDFDNPTPLVEGLLLTALVGAYVVYGLGTYTIYQVVLKLRLWQAAVESMVISGYAALDHVRADESAASAVGEGLADALGSGGI